ncbi:ferritin-like domain-containing protein [Flavobacterium ginsengisoli]|uniref:ferritin-like domain-containing protein n=1 Tax=Flavobacterium ginsengisoli TaxID=871694 RepID=UPI0024153BAD|nr:PA2169 family four-helix-bundle protein [Flavobacterium ginsengisoli]
MIHTDETIQETVKTLEGLISILEDGKLGYTDAAEHVENPAMKTDFLEYARERALFIVELQNQINKLGKSTDTSGGGPLGVLHRTWIDIKSAFTGGDTESIINACITGEEVCY